VAKARELEHRQPLVVVHREHDVAAGQAGRQECRVRGNRSLDAQAAPPQRRERGLQRLDLLAPEMTRFAGMRIDAADEDARPADAVQPSQVTVEHGDDGAQSLGRQRAAHARERQVSRRERDAHAAAGQQHHRAAAARAAREVFRVPRKADTGIVDDALLDRRGDHRRKLTTAAARDGAIEQREHIARVARIEAARHAARRERHVQPFDARACRYGGIVEAWRLAGSRCAGACLQAWYRR
jgi:hypothetical protein